ncbi:hypothetical protein NEHOM01_1447 [Nematocida homosporus]|uniref:uncharacterized protein n=1 Tax=Nematocida homosporus TaxID=1912981 RepID=UPI0022210277|nr:uncharacterized protein NEHOM01_1447 [Nematocida homosporus]KAI5186414.1 hypothetical protein NEHOM01_1447 [Nematocida homosporus]
MTETEKRIQSPVQAFKETTLPEEEKTNRVAELARQLEKTLDVNHFLNTRFNRHNHSLCERLRKEREAAKKEE